jgi:hypothetical protein
LFQDHRDGNLEAVGMTMACCLHQAIPSRFQVTVPVKNSGIEEQLLETEIRVQARSQDEDGNVYLLPMPPKPCDTRFRPGSER